MHVRRWLVDRGGCRRVRSRLAERTAERRTLLYIGDDESTIALLERLIARRKGWGLLVARDEALGMEWASSVARDVILLDLYAAEMRGLTALRRRDSPMGSWKTDVVVVTTDAEPQQVRRLLEGGAQDHLATPLVEAEVLAVLDRCEQHQMLK